MPPIPSRGWTYLLVVGSAVAVLAAGLGLSLAVGRAEPAPAVMGSSRSLPGGPPFDHDSRPRPTYDTAPLVTGSTPAPGVRLTASDVGITPTTITIGVILIGLGAVSAFGIDASSLDPKVQRTYWDFAVGRINGAGGIQGRRVVVAYVTADILSTDSMRAACRELTEDRHVFAVANVLGVSGDPILCVTRDHGTPYLGIDGADASYYPLSQGRLVTIEPRITRTLDILFGRLGTLGWLAGRRVGVIHTTGAGGVDSGVLRKALAAAGAASFVDGPLGAGDPLVVTGQVASAERRMQQGGVDTVMLLTNAVYGTVFAIQADQSRYAPDYVMSDLGYATAGDSYLANMPKSFFREAIAVTTTEAGRGHARLPESALDAGCRHAFENFAGHTVDRDSADDVAALASCALIQLVTMGLNGAGANPTRLAFADSLAQAGPFILPGFGRALLGGSRLDAADDVGVASAIEACQCYTSVDGFIPAPGS